LKVPAKWSVRMTDRAPPQGCIHAPNDDFLGFGDGVASRGSKQTQFVYRQAVQQISLALTPARLRYRGTLQCEWEVE
jgi:hypothetical protein